jgi:hypothetical protein
LSRIVLPVAARRRPTAEDRLEAIRITLHGIATEADPLDVVPLLAPVHPKNNTFPGEVLLELAADALDEAGASRDRLVPYEDIRERYLPEVELRGRTQHHKSHYALQAAAMIHGGVEPDLLGEVTWWSNDDLWVWSFYALVIYLRAAAERTGEPLAVLCDRVAARHGISSILRNRTTARGRAER